MATKKLQFTFSPVVESVDALADVLKTQSTFYDRKYRNADGTPMRWRKNSQLKRFKRDPFKRILLSFKHGLGYKTADYEQVVSLEDFNTQFACSYEVVKE